MARHKVVVQKADMLGALPRFALSPELAEHARQAQSPERLEVVWSASEDPDDVAAVIADAVALVTENARVPRELIAAGKNLKIIVNGGLIHANVDVLAANELGVPVAIVPLYTGVAVAEHAILLALASLKKLHLAHASVIRGDNPFGLTPVFTQQYVRPINYTGLTNMGCLIGKTMGIVGLGEIGSHVAHLARAFGMRVLYNNRHRRSREVEERMGVHFYELDDLLREADIVSLHFPHTPESEGKIGRRELGLMKRTAFLINTARGNIVNQPALVEALKNRQIAGAGLDVQSYEPVPIDDPLLQLDNVILTPHCAMGTPEIGIGDIERMFRPIVRMLDGLPLADGEVVLA